jgi:hypothetical protein
MGLSAAEVLNGMHPSLGHREHFVAKSVTFHGLSRILGLKIEDYVVLSSQEGARETSNSLCRQYPSLQVRLASVPRHPHEYH